MATFSVQDVFNITGHGIVLVGAVLDGPLRLGMRAQYQDYSFKINRIEAHHQNLQEAAPGDNVGVGIEKVSGPAEPAPSGFALFRKDKYAETMKTLKGKTVEFL